MSDFIKIKPKICVVYCRISSESQKEGGGIHSQETRCLEYANYNGYKIIKTFKDEGFSGGLLERPGIKELFKFVDQYNTDNIEKIELFLCDDIDRIARDYEVHLELKRMMYQRNMKFETVNQKFEETPIGKFIEGIFALKSGLFREENTHRVITRQEARLLDGYRPWDYPVGYQTIKAPVGGKLMIRKEPEASIIKEALEDYANGVLNTHQEVAEFLQRKGFTLRRRVNKRKVNGPEKIHRSFVGRMLSNILYSGYIEYKKTSRDKKTGLIKKVWDISLRKAKHEGLISYETYQKIQDRLKKKTPFKPQVKKVNDHFPLRNFLFCDCCHLPLSSGIRRKHPERGWKDIPYYTFSKKCIYGGKGLNAEKLHAKFDSIMEGLKMDNRFVNFLKELLSEEYENRQKDRKLVIKNVDKEIQSIDGNIDNIINSLASTQSDIVRKKLEQKIEELEHRKQLLKNQNTLTTKQRDFKKTLEYATKVFENPYSIRKDCLIDDKRTFLKLVFRNDLEVNKKLEDFGTLPISRLFLLNKDFLQSNVPVIGDDGNRTRV